jgi:hypothetical protein
MNLAPGLKIRVSVLCMDAPVSRRPRMAGSDRPWAPSNSTVSVKFLTSAISMSIQPVVATHWLNRSGERSTDPFPLGSTA